jgi:hypothetical protein
LLGSLMVYQGQCCWKCAYRGGGSRRVADPRPACVQRGPSPSGCSILRCALSSTPPRRRWPLRLARGFDHPNGRLVHRSQRCNLAQPDAEGSHLLTHAFHLDVSTLLPETRLFGHRPSQEAKALLGRQRSIPSPVSANSVSTAVGRRLVPARWWSWWRVAKSALLACFED